MATLRRLTQLAKLVPIVGSGVLLILEIVGGIGDSWRSFERVLSHLPESMHAIALTMRGHGDASRPESGTEPTGADLRKALDAVLAGRPVSEEQTPSLGCNIKWKESNAPEYFNPQGVGG